MFWVYYCFVFSKAAAKGLNCIFSDSIFKQKEREWETNRQIPATLRCFSTWTLEPHGASEGIIKRWWNARCLNLIWSKGLFKHGNKFCLQVLLNNSFKKWKKANSHRGVLCGGCVCTCVGFQETQLNSASAGEWKKSALVWNNLVRMQVPSVPRGGGVREPDGQSDACTRVKVLTHRERICSAKNFFFC